MPSALFCEWMSSVGMSLALDHLKGFARTAGVVARAAVAASEAELDRFEQFLDRIERAHQAETTPVFEAAAQLDPSQRGAGTAARARTGERQPAAAVAFLLEALQLYAIRERDDWITFCKVF